MTSRSTSNDSRVIPSYATGDMVLWLLKKLGRPVTLSELSTKLEHGIKALDGGLLVRFEGLGQVVRDEIEDLEPLRFVRRVSIKEENDGVELTILGRMFALDTPLPEAFTKAALEDATPATDSVKI